MANQRLEEIIYNTPKHGMISISLKNKKKKTPWRKKNPNTQ